jgi:hypothetical protein
VKPDLSVICRRLERLVKCWVLGEDDVGVAAAEAGESAASGGCVVVVDDCVDGECFYGCNDDSVGGPIVVEDGDLCDAWLIVVGIGIPVEGVSICDWSAPGGGVEIWSHA